MSHMKTGDFCLIYHSGNQKPVAGIARVLRGLVDDKKRESRKAPGVHIRAVKRLAKPVSLSELKKKNELRDFDLIRRPRLSVTRVPAEI